MVRRMLFLAVAVFIISMVFLLDSEASVVLQPGPTDGKDTWIQEGDTTPNGNDTQLYLNKAAGATKLIESLIQFNLSSISSNATIISSTLSLYCFDNNNNSGGLTINSYRINADWNEGNVTWSTRPAMNSGNSTESSTTITNIGWYSWDLTNLTQAWVNTTVSNYGVALYDHNANQQKIFYSSDYMTNTTLRPMLTIDYSLPKQSNPDVPEPLTISLLGLGLGLAGLFEITRKKVSS